MDGDRSTSWTSASGYPAWIIVDLNKPKPIREIKVALGASRPYQYKVEGSNSLDGPYTIIVDQTRALPECDRARSGKWLLRLGSNQRPSD
ncbi:hypothetical protein DDZ13_07865 [Coraliomargarita sinensis]|uniref:F5/8 type C domain-containing protein n=1 Tax=Coraliomargarita sinensis TaxID=2174842 RepID=A0A317ZG13_9BACT|nr:hypothetical protein DDZ13_07865 [Coraliomargarita sinensis]